MCNPTEDSGVESTPGFTIGVTTAVCGQCQAVIPAKVESDGRDVYFRKFCPRHGESVALVRRDVDDYLRSQRFVKPSWIPEVFAGNASLPCPGGCGLCSRHEQHLCLPIVEVTSRCNLACPICIAAPAESSNDSRQRRDLDPAELRKVLDRLVQAERQVDVLNLSGGEPLLHPRLLEILDDALSRKEIVRVSLSTNGLAFLDNPGLVRAVRERGVVVSLQFDGFDDRIYQVLRGQPLLGRKLEILEALEQADITTSLTMTAAAGVNDDQFPAMLDYLFSKEHVVSLMVQPLAFAGRAAALAGQIGRLTLPDVVRLLGQAGHPAVAATDLVPLPCSHPLCFSLAFYLMLNSGRPLSVNRLAGVSDHLDLLSNRVIFGLDADEQERLKELVYKLWSGPAAALPDSPAVLATLRDILRSLSSVETRDGFDPRAAFTLMERRVKSIFIHAFQDAETFDLARVRRCCQAYPQSDGRLIPACVYNVLHRGQTMHPTGDPDPHGVLLP